jgi:hypothetical protein
MPSYRMVYGDNEQVVRETYHDVELQREDGWTILFRGDDAILRVHDEHIQSLETLDENVPGEPSWRSVTRDD